jgi:hypothetical protein
LQAFTPTSDDCPPWSFWRWAFRMLVILMCVFGPLSFAAGVSAVVSPRTDFEWSERLRSVRSKIRRELPKHSSKHAVADFLERHSLTPLYGFPSNDLCAQVSAHAAGFGVGELFEVHFEFNAEGRMTEWKTVRKVDCL